jgi:hypothetical protein
LFFLYLEDSLFFSTIQQLRNKWYFPSQDLLMVPSLLCLQSISQIWLHYAYCYLLTKPLSSLAWSIAVGSNGSHCFQPFPTVSYSLCSSQSDFFEHHKIDHLSSVLKTLEILVLHHPPSLSPYCHIMYSLPCSPCSSHCGHFLLWTNEAIQGLLFSYLPGRLSPWLAVVIIEVLAEILLLGEVVSSTQWSLS